MHKASSTTSPTNRLPSIFTEKTNHPIPKLLSFHVVVLIFSYYGYAGQEQDALQYISKATRSYVKSQQMKLLRKALNVHRFAPYYDWPNRSLNVEDLKATGRSAPPGGR